MIKFKFLILPVLFFAKLYPMNNDSRLIQNLVNAANRGDIDEVNNLIAQNVDVNGMTSDDKSALLEASAQGHEEVVRVIIAVPGCNINICNSLKWNALHFACWFGHKNVVKLLVDNGIKVNEKVITTLDVNRSHLLIEQENSALHFASFQNFKDIVEILVKVPGIDLNPMNKIGIRPILGCVDNHNIEMLKVFLKSGAFYLNIIDLVEEIGYQDMLEILNKQRKIDAFKPQVFKAIEEDNYGKLKYLATKVTFNLKDEKGNNVLHLAMQYGSVSVLKFLIANYLEQVKLWICEKNNYGYTPFEWGMMCDNLEMVKILTQVSYANNLEKNDE